MVKILSPNEFYEPHIYLDNGDTIYFGDKIQKFEESSSESSTKPIVKMPWQASNNYKYSQATDENAYQKSFTRHSDMFKSIVNSVRNIIVDSAWNIFVEESNERDDKDEISMQENCLEGIMKKDIDILSGDNESSSIVLDTNKTKIRNSREYIFPHKSAAEAIQILRHYGTMRDVPGDGSCGYHCVMLLL